MTQNFRREDSKERGSGCAIRSLIEVIDFEIFAIRPKVDCMANRPPFGGQTDKATPVAITENHVHISED